MSPDGPTSSAHGQVAIVGGTGALGFGLAVRLADAGLKVRIGSRSAERAAEAAARLPAGEGLLNEEAVRDVPIVVLAVPFLAHAENLKAISGALEPGQILLDTTVPLAAAVGGRATRSLGVWQGSAAQQAQEMAPEGVRVVSALHTVSGAMLADRVRPLDEDVLVCGDRKVDKQSATDLIQLIPGLRCVDCGRLEMARICEQLTALLIGVNGRYKTHAGIRITGLEGRV